MKNRRLQEILKEFPDDFEIQVAVCIPFAESDLEIKDIKEESNKVILFVEPGPVST